MTLVFGQEDFSTKNSLESALEFLVEQMMSRINVCTPVKVVAVHGNGRSGIVGTVDVTPLVNQQTVLGESIPHTTIYGIPFIRVQGGSAALIVDPQVGDLGFCLFADSDISSVKDTGSASVPPTFRKFDMADGIYIGGWGIKQTPAQWVVIDADGIDIQAGPDGTLNEAALEMSTVIQTTWTQMVAALNATYDTCEITVPEFHILGNLHVDGIVHCTWEGENVSVGFGGTGADLSSTGGPNMVVAQLTPGAPLSVVPLSDLSLDVKYTNDNPSPFNIGSIPAGSTFALQTMKQMWDRLLYGTQFVVGGPWQVSDSTARNGIPADCRVLGAIATTLNDYHQWQLQGGTTNADWVDITSGGGPTTITVELGATFATNQPYQIVSGIAQPVTSTSASFPFVDGITLESGASTQVVPVANGETAIYPTPLALPGSDGAMLYLSQTGTLTATVPSSAAGDVWAVPLVRRVTSTAFVYAPQTPIKLA